MRILLSSFQCVPNEGSELGNGWHWATALAGCGHQVTILTDPSHQRTEPPQQPGVRFLYAGNAASRVTRLSSSLATVEYYLRWQDAALKRARQDAERYDVVHHVSWGSLHLGSRLWRLGFPLVYGPIGGGQTAPGAFRGYFGRNWPAERIRTATTGPMLRLNPRSRETLRNATVTLVTNLDTGAACKRLGAQDVRFMVAEGLTPDWLVDHRSRPPDVPVVLWVGRFLPRKAPALAVEAFARLRRAMPVKLVMAGDGPLVGEIRDLVTRLGLDADVDLLGRVPWAQIRSLYDSASVFLFTSLRDSSGSQFLEALSRGLPAVALDHHGIGDFEVGTAALKVPLPREPRQLAVGLADALQTILTDDQWDTRSADGVRWAGKHTWTAKAATAVELYREILGTSSGEEAGPSRIG